MTHSLDKVDVPIGRVEFMGEILHLVEHHGQLVGTLPDESGQLVAVIHDERVTAAGCRRLLRLGIDLLLNRAERLLRKAADDGMRSDGMRGARSGERGALSQ